ncbi:dolichol-phosphate mannosyltransferase [Hanstruepera neustonica]|uniref:Dolichol-phosphate mannosyltransferase n=1 Tax=Hanstruepera neustonica TaxID=1445657 RepID=A0A2K1DVR8_9FLAO|nr:glycosyltransferase family 2 protein [Hanstruepera neustonica]PNQ72136.1 dolichol-phosphate mannosyltransferase [Hanstruepera neustonica]
MAYEFTIIVPVYNEEDNLLRVEKELLEYSKIASKKTKILFVNDGSKDNSQTIIETIVERQENFSYISFAENRGLSAAIKAGFDYANSELVGYIDSDLQTAPEDFNLLLEYIGEYDLVTGVRANRKDSFVKNMSSTIANGIRRAFTHDGMDDTGCPLKVIKTEYAKRIPMFKGLHRFLPAMILLQQGKIIQIPVQHFPRIAGQAKFGLWNRLIGPLMDCFAYLWMKKKYINYSVAKQSE